MRKGNFRVKATTCSIVSVSPVSGPIGTPLVLIGTNFGLLQGSSTITVGGVLCTPLLWTAVSITVLVPPGCNNSGISLNIGGNICTCPFKVTKTCPPGSVPGCDGVCNSGKVWDCHNAKCYDPAKESPLWGKDCAGVCFELGTAPPNKPDCAGICFGPDTHQNLPKNYLDCKGVCYGPDVPGVTPTYPDCKGVCGGDAFYDCGGNCIGRDCEVLSAKKVTTRKAVPSNNAKNVQKKFMVSNRLR